MWAFDNEKVFVSSESKPLKKKLGVWESNMVKRRIIGFKLVDGDDPIAPSHSFWVTLTSYINGP